MKLTKIDQVAVAQEFHISVTPLGEDEYLVRIERVAPGVPLAEEQVKWPVEDWLAQAQQLMNDPLLGVLQGNSAFTNDLFYLPEWEEPVSQSSLNLVALGQQLYNALFQGSLRDSWMMAQAIAQNQRSILRLRLGLKGKRLPRLPWEVLYAGDRPLATGTDVVFSRYQLSTGRISPVQALPSGSHQPLKILMVIASPSDQETLELAEEASQLQAELRSRSPNELPAIQLTILEQPGREQLTQALEQGQYQVFHYAGHSNLGDSGGDVYLVSNKTGLTETLNGADLAGLLVNNGVQLAVFNSCRGAYTAPSERANGKERNLAEAIVARGIPGVLAMAERIPDEVALTLTRLLYRNLNQGYPIDLSLSRARQGLISAYGSNQLYWALPVLYLHPEFDGFLTKVDDAAQTIAELFAITDPPDDSLSVHPQAALFTPPTGRRIPPSYVEIEDELDGLSPEDLAEDEDFVNDLEHDDLDADDPGAFIQDLLRQLDPKPTSSNLGQTSTGIESLPPVTSETGDLEPPRYPVNNQSPAPTESGTITPTTETPQSLSERSENLKNSTGGGSGKSPGFPGWSQNWQRFPKLWVIFGAIGVIVIALLGFWFFQNREQSLGRLSQPPSNVPTVPLSQTGDLKQADTAKVTAIAIEQLSQGNIAAGQKAVEALLDRGALQAADAALAVVPNEKLEDPAVSFLRGRLVWQSIQASNQDYAVSDARRYWETAIKAQPKSSSYLNALGFAYYAEGEYERANNAWWEALNQSETRQGTTNLASDQVKQEMLTTYAGLALGMWKSAQQLPAEQRSRLLNESIKLRQKVMTDDPVNFQSDALSKNWLWSEKAIQDWRSLLAVRS